MKISEMFPTRYATGEDLAGKPVSLTIASLRSEQMHPQPGAPAVSKWVLYFAHATKGVILSAPLARQIADALGDDTDAWPGKRITIYPLPMTVAGRACIAIRARPATNGESSLPTGLLTPDEDES